MKYDSLLSRSLSSFLTLTVALTCSFWLVHSMPGNYVEHLLNTTPGGFSLPAESNMLKRQFDLDRPILVRYGLYITDVFRGDWGTSFAYAKPVTSLIGDRVLCSLTLLLPAKLFSMVLGVLIGVYSGWHAERRRDLAILSLMLFINAIPSYIWALLAVFILAYHLNIFPLAGYLDVEALEKGIEWGTIAYHGLLPLLTMTVCGIPGTFYLVRNTMSLVSGEDYITTARATGISEMSLVMRHALPNALLPVVTLIPLQIAHLLMGSVFIESVFSWPGIGLLTVQAIASRDLPVLQGVLLIYTALLLGGNLLADLCYTLIDPRVHSDA